VPSSYSTFVHPDVLRLLFSKTGFADRVTGWAAEAGTRLLGPAELLTPLPT
jgi:hypothetical protein